jgi:hypothetical protein
LYIRIEIVATIASAKDASSLGPSVIIEIPKLLCISFKRILEYPSRSCPDLNGSPDRAIGHAISTIQEIPVKFPFLKSSVADWPFRTMEFQIESVGLIISKYDSWSAVSIDHMALL